MESSSLRALAGNGFNAIPTMSTSLACTAAFTSSTISWFHAAILAWMAGGMEDSGKRVRGMGIPGRTSAAVWPGDPGPPMGHVFRATVHRPDVRASLAGTSDSPMPFTALGLSADLARAVARLGLETPTPIQ